MIRHRSIQLLEEWRCSRRFGCRIRSLEAGAAAVVLHRNHPSEVCTPRRSDEALAQTLKAALALLDVRVLDRVITSDSGAFSMVGSGHIRSCSQVSPIRLFRLGGPATLIFLSPLAIRTVPAIAYVKKRSRLRPAASAFAIRGTTVRPRSGCCRRRWRTRLALSERRRVMAGELRHLLNRLQETVGVFLRSKTTPSALEPFCPYLFVDSDE
jgi:hypothetical protein